MRQLAALGLVLVVSALVAAGASARSQIRVSNAEPHLSCARAISWANAKAAIGRVATVKGRVAGTYYAASSNGSPTFLNLGADYPSARRFQIIIWGRDRGRFGSPESRFRGKTVCVRGLIRPYAGVAEVFVSSPSQIRTV